MFPFSRRREFPDTERVAALLEIGDLVFIRVKARPFLEVSAATNCWSNHVGIVIDISGAQPLIAESTFPVSRYTTWRRFVGRSEAARFAVCRLEGGALTHRHAQIRRAAGRRMGVLYDTGFNLHSSRQFCSRFVREVLDESAGVQIGRVQTFDELYADRPDARLRFWRLWFFGRIPWARETVTPASLLRSARLSVVVEGRCSR
ncbi:MULTISPECIES: YebB family permuted papain-like enzyme [unclassified Paraburkholderia]|uniref:YebB family permuted papain-like enzyme n=1 Tax=unclassified Paraburkholderia TaxID=2615204 RepID=UPI002AB03FA5|nr:MULTISPECIES: YebB family permuted papain-like enzyme [unclassified Paraburkholderia]